MGECSGGGVWWKGIVWNQLLDYHRNWGGLNCRHEIIIYQVISHSFTIYDKVIECIQLINCCIAYQYGVNVFYNNDTCRFVVVICFVYMGDNTNHLFSFVLDKTENT